MKRVTSFPSLPGLVARAGALIGAVATLWACGGGVPVRLTVDEFTFDLSMNEVTDGFYGELVSQGVFPDGSPGMPVLWPESLPPLHYLALVKTPPMPVDLTPEPNSAEAEKYAEINRVGKAIERIEINRLILRLEQNDLTVALPELRLQVADAKDANPEDRFAWRTVGKIPGAAAGTVADLELEYLPSGESFLNAQLGDDVKELAMRVVGRIEVDTAAEPRMPAGSAKVRLILVATFFVKPEEAL